MSEEKKTTYRLYVLGLNDAEKAAKHRFHRVNSRYALVYTSEKIENAGEITENELWRLDQNEKDWLSLCNVKILLEDAQERQEAIMERLSENVARLEDALKKQAESEQTAQISEEQG